MNLSGIKVPDTSLVRDATELAHSSSEPYLFNHVMRSWLFSILLSEGLEVAPDAELLAVAVILHDLGLTDLHTGENRFEVDGANAARAFLKSRSISTQNMQIVDGQLEMITWSIKSDPRIASVKNLTFSSPVASSKILAV